MIDPQSFVQVSHLNGLNASCNVLNCIEELFKEYNSSGQPFSAHLNDTQTIGECYFSRNQTFWIVFMGDSRIRQQFYSLLKV